MTTTSELTILARQPPWTDCSESFPSWQPGPPPHGLARGSGNPDHPKTGSSFTLDTVALTTNASAGPPRHLSFWGKARSPDAGVSAPFHPIAYHLLDVAAVVEELLRVRPLALRTARRLLGVGDEAAVRFFRTAAGLHDLGKFAPAFLAKVPELWPVALRPLHPDTARQGWHTEDGYVLWTERLANVLADRIWIGGAETLEILAPAIFGHHGRPVGRPGVGVAFRFPPPTREVAIECAVGVIGLLCPEPLDATPLDPARARIASWWLSGLVTTADWIGSGQSFRYTAPLADDPTLGRYFEQARATAAEAVRRAGLVAPVPRPSAAFSTVTGSSKDPTPAQRWAEEVRLPDGPCLVVLEDTTGSGKTETAQLLVHRLVSTGRADGAYWAMPTQATANGMYGRQEPFLRGLFDFEAGPLPSLVLAHGQQRLHDRFRRTVLDGAARRPDELRAVAAVGTADDVPAEIMCSAFMADDRRAAMLADVGAGTIDQALLGVLPSRFNTIRLFGLSGKVLVVDEAHAYDAYMQIELEELLTFQSALGGSAIVLSATLPTSRRASLVEAWQNGLAAGGWVDGEVADQGLESRAYPLATIVGSEGWREQPLQAAEWAPRAVPVRLIHTISEALEHASNLARVGGAVAWIRNTVDDCMAAAESLRSAGLDKVIVFHARFTQHDRQALERSVLERFGPSGRPEDRVGWIVLATQVLEQSLDLDFDAMISDIAPIDLLIQRAGRLWRHPFRKQFRPSCCRCELVVFSPVPDPDPPKDWATGPFGGTAAVYRNLAVLWRTARLLEATGEIRAPEGLRPLIEGVYGDNAAPVPEGLVAAEMAAEGAVAGGAATARYATLKVSDGYHPSAAPWENDLRVQTRLGDERNIVRLARVEVDGSLSPWAPGESDWKAWALSEVAVRASGIPPGSTAPDQFTAAIQRVRSNWGRFEQERTVIPLTRSSDGVWVGEISAGSRSPVRISYTPDRGLAFRLEKG